MRAGALILLFSLVSFLSCNREIGPETIAYGHDICAECKMMIVDQRHGGEFVTSKGKVFKFDSVECLKHFIAGPEGKAGVSYLVDFLNPGSFIKAETSIIAEVESIPGPMGSKLVATGSLDQLRTSLGSEPSSTMRWDELTQQHHHHQ